MIKNFQISPPPHTRVPASAAGITWSFVLALAPVWCVLLVRRPWETLQVSGFIFITAFFIEAAAAFLSKKKINFKDGSAALWALLLALMISGSAGFGILFLTVFVTVFLGKVFYGGREGVWMHPSWLGYAFFVLNAPGALLFEKGAFFFWNPFSGFWPALITLALLLGGMILIFKKNTAWEIPFLYLGLLFIPCQLLGLQTSLSLPEVLLTAFWILPEPAVSPCSRQGRMYFSIGAALLTLALDLLSVPAAPVFGALFLNLLTPWMDEWILPRGISFEARVQGSRTSR